MSDSTHSSSHDVTPDAEGDKTSAVTLSTRVTAHQRGLIDRAAEVANQTPAKFVREAAVDRAVDVINAAGDSTAALRQLARVVVEQLRNPRIVEKWADDGPHPQDDPDPDCVEIPWVNLQSDELREHLAHEYYCRRQDGQVCIATEPKRPPSSQLDQIELAFKMSGTEFTKMIVELWRTAMHDGSNFTPKVWKQSSEDDPSDE